MFCVTLLLAVTCLLYRADLSRAALPTQRVITCKNNAGIHRLSCDSGVISVQTALYGRADTKTCSRGRPRRQLANTKCSQLGAVDVLRKRCDGKKVCELSASRIFRGRDPCRGIYKYLDTTHICVPARPLHLCTNTVHSVTCERSSATLQCDGGQVIFVYGADYGRRDHNICSVRRPPSQLRNVYCSRPTSRVAQRCNGIKTCTIQASNSVFGDPCRGTYKYLKVAYRCQFQAVVCEGNKANLKCPEGQVISVYSAVYGRSDCTTCSSGRPAVQVQNVKCQSPTNKVAQVCDRKNYCSVDANNSMFGDPCVGTYKYLEVVYLCQAPGAC